MLDKIKGLKKYTDCSMPTNENELRQKESVAGYNQAIEDVVKIFSIYDVSQQRELVCDCLPMSTQVSTINGRYICCTCNKPLLSQACG